MLKSTHSGIRRLVCLTAAVVLLAISALPVMAFTIPAQSAEFYVNDMADLLSDDTESYIIDVNKDLQSQSGAQVVVVTVNDLDGASIEEYATAMFRQYGIGSAEENNGVLLLLALEERLFRIEVGYGLEGVLNDGKTGRIQDNYVIPYFKEGNWDEGMRNGFDAVIEEIAGEYDIEVSSNAPVKIQSGNEEDLYPYPFGLSKDGISCIPLAVAAIIGFVIGKINKVPLTIIGSLGTLFGIFKVILYVLSLGYAILSTAGSILFMFIGFAVGWGGGSGGGSSGGGSYRSSGYHSSSRSRSSSSSSSWGSSSGRSWGGGGSSGGGGSTRGF